MGWLIGRLIWVKPGCVSVNPSLVELAGVAGWLAGRFGSDQAGSCVLTQSVYPSQVALGWFGWPVAWLVGGWLVGWLVGWFGPDQAGWCVLPHSVNPSQVELGWLVVGPRWVVFLAQYVNPSQADNMQTKTQTVPTLSTQAKIKKIGQTRHPGLDWCKSCHPPHMIDPQHAN